MISKVFSRMCISFLIILFFIVPVDNTLGQRRTAPRRPSRNPVRSKARANSPRRSSKRTIRPTKSAKRTKRPPTYGSIRYSSSKKPYRSHAAKTQRNYRNYNMNKIQNKRTVKHKKRQRQETLEANRRTNRKQTVGKRPRLKEQRQAKVIAAAKKRNLKTATPEQIKNRRKAIVGAAAAAGGAAALKNQKEKRELNKNKIKEKIKNRDKVYVGGWKSRPRYRDKLPSKYAYLKYKGRPYYRHKYCWYRRCWRDDEIVYEPCYPPIGYFYPVLPDTYETVVVDGRTYYRDDDDVYYTESEQDGQKGYAVAEPIEQTSQQAIAENTEASPQEKTTSEEQQISEQAQTTLISEESGKDSKAIDILKKMSDFIAKQKRFSFSATNILDEISESGEKIQTKTHQTFYINRAEGQKLACDIKSDKKNRYFVYDGKKIILYDRDKNVYATVDAPDTIDSMLDMIIAKYGVNLPLIDILFDDPFLAMSAEIQSAKYAGTEKVEGKQCHHLIFKQSEIDWEIWIQTGNKPLPIKLAITYKSLQGTPKFASIISNWNLSPEFKENQFSFKPPAKAEKVEIEPRNNDNL